MTAAAPAIDLAARLRDVRVGVRSDLEVVRHVFRGEPSYILRDPLTLQNHRLNTDEYALFVTLSPSRTLGETFNRVVTSGMLEAGDEQEFYQFIFALHRLGFLRLPISDEKALYQRYVNRQRARTRQRLFGALFLQIPLWNPEPFLQRTGFLFTPLFTPIAFVAWLLLMLGAARIAVANYTALSGDLGGVLALSNLPLMWVMLIVLKTIHEFGHAYACRAFGVTVPEMGIYLILGTPCAYVDASHSWSLPSKLRRIIICLAGMYFESVAAAACLFIWVSTPPGLINSAAYNGIFLASLVTILFNINPLMRYDGYYVLSDAVEVPNLRQRSLDALHRVLKRTALGLREPPSGNGAVAGGLLALFGAAFSGYRVLVLLALAAILTSKLSLIGLPLALMMVGGPALVALLRLGKYLWFAGETQPVRARAIAVSILAFLVLPAGVAFLPLPTHVAAAGILHRETEAVVRNESTGFVEALHVTPGAAAAQGAPLVELRNDTLEEVVLDVSARLEASQTLVQALQATDAAGARQEQLRAESIRRELSLRTARRDALTIASPISGYVVSCLGGNDESRYLEAGQVVATVVQGRWEVRAALTAAQTRAVQPRVGQAVEFRPSGHAADVISGRITRVTPGGTDLILSPALTHLGGGEIATDPHSHRAAEPYFEVVATIEADERDARLQYGATGQMRLAGPPEAVGLKLYRTVIRVWESLLKA